MRKNSNTKVRRRRKGTRGRPKRGPQPSAGNHTVERAAAFLRDPTHPDGDLLDLLQRMSAGGDARLHLAMRALAVRKVEILGKLQAAQGALVETLFDGARIRTIRDPEVLARLIDVAGRQIQRDTCFLAERLQEDGDRVLADLALRLRRERQERIRARAEQMPVAKRMQVRQLLDRVCGLEPVHAEIVQDDGEQGSHRRPRALIGDGG